MSDLNLEKSWLFNVNNLSHFISGTATNQNAISVFGIKQVLIGGSGRQGWTDGNGAPVAGPTFWTVDYSSDSVAAGTPGDGVDRWTASDKVVWGSTAGANSWIVLKNPNPVSPATLYWLIACEAPSTDSNLLDMYVSKVGFTGGSATARPTATDEQRMLAATNWGSGTAYPIRYHVLMSSDGAMTRVFINRGFNLQGLWIIEPMSGVTQNIENSLIASAWGGSGSNALTLNDFSLTSGPLARKIGGPTISGIISSEGSKYAGTVHAGLPGPNRVTWNDIAARSMFNAISVWGTDYPVRGHVGSLVDMWFGSDLLTSGQVFPGDYTRRFVTMGTFVIPWNGTIMEGY